MIAVVALIVFGPEKLPEMGRKVGSFVADVRRMSNDVRSEFHGVMEDDDDEDPFFSEEETSTAASAADEAEAATTRAPDGPSRHPEDEGGRFEDGRAADVAVAGGRSSAGEDESSPPARVDT